MKTVQLTIDFDIGTLDEIGLGGLKQKWIDATDDGNTYHLTTGAGLGNPFLEASMKHPGGQAVYARADIRPLVQQLFSELDRAFTGLPERNTS